MIFKSLNLEYRTSNIKRTLSSTYVHEIYPKELTLTKSNQNSRHKPFLDLDISIENDIFKTKIYDKRDDFDFPIVNFPFLDGDIPIAPSYGVYISQRVRVARICKRISEFNECYLFITEKLLHQGYQYHKLLKKITKFYYRYETLLRKYN